MHKAHNASLAKARVRAGEHGKGHLAKGRLVAVVLVVVVLTVAVALTACAQQSQTGGSSDSAVQQAQVAETPSAATQGKGSTSGVIQQTEASRSMSQVGSRTTDSEATESEVETYEPDTVLVSLKEGIDAQDALRAIEQETGFEGLSVASQGEGYVKLELPNNETVERAVEMLGHSTVVESAQPNFRYYLMDDTGAEADANPASAGVNQLQAGTLSELFTQSIELNDPDADKLWGLSSVQAYEAWETMRCNHSVTVAVIDNVFLADHEDLKNNVAVAYNAVTKKVNDDVAGSLYTSGDKEHGTHVAGIIAAQANNSKGVAGVSYNANLLLLRTANDDAEFYTDALMSAYDYLIENKDKYNVRVVNMSLGGYMSNDEWLPKNDETGNGQDNSSTGNDDLLLNAIDRAWEAGIITVTSAGNAGSYGSTAVSAPFSCYPGDYDRCVNVIALRSTTKSSSSVERWSSSNYNLPGRSNKDIAAPGASIYSTSVDSASSYETKTGTSMAAPCVSGILALMFATYPDLTPDQAVETLYATATDLGEKGWDEEYGSGEANALAAVQACYEMAEEAGYHPSINDDPADNPSGDDPGDDPSGDPSGDNPGDDDDTPAVKPIKKLANPLVVHSKLLKVRARNLKASKKTYVRKKVLTISSKRGTLSYKKISGSSRLTIDKKTGSVTVKKNTKRGNYRMKVSVRAAGNYKYASGSTVVNVKVSVR